MSLRLLSDLRWAYVWVAIAIFWCLIRIDPTRAVRVLQSIPQDRDWALILEGLGYVAEARRIRARIEQAEADRRRLLRQAS